MTPNTSETGVKVKIALICLSPAMDGGEMPLPMPSYGIHRIHAAALSAPSSVPREVRVFDLGHSNFAELSAAVSEFGPDLIGMSVYVWSTPGLLNLAVDLRAKLPNATILFGGPSARTELFDLPSYAARASVLDALCVGDGEAVIQDIIALDTITRAGLATIGGLALRLPQGGWLRTVPARQIPMSEIPSPYALGLMPKGAVAYLETYRGCPLSCRFCEWGVTRPARDVFDADYIAHEIAAFRRLEAPAVFLLDAGLNLNSRAFRNLAQAHVVDGFLAESLFWAEIYPTVIKDEHLEFLRDVGAAYLGVGLQSMDDAVLRAHDRPFDMTRFGSAVERLSQVAQLEVQIIMGLPGDTPEGFRRTLKFAMSLPVGSVRAYHCLVLPDALLTRARPEWAIEFEPDTLAMVANRDWSASAITAMRHELTDRAHRTGGSAGAYWWLFRR
jgi:radical SAM superfamily enzyme YgiQ (UPF0313 family)